MGIRLLLTCAVLAAPYALLVAQETRAQETRAQEARVDSLRVLIQRAEANERAYRDSVDRAMSALDTLIVSPLKFLVTPSLRGRTARVAASAAERLSGRLGNTAIRLNQDWIVVKPAGNASGDTLTLSFKDPKAGRLLEQLWGSVDDAMLSDWFFHIAAGLFGRRMLGTNLLAWTGDRADASAVLDTVSTVQWTSLRLDLVSASATVARRCYDGDIEACLSALELTPTKDPVTEWYDAQSRRAYVEDNEWESRRADREQQDRCISGDDASCVAVMRILFKRYQPRPAPGNRLTLVRMAIALGGLGAYERLMSSTGQPSERLAATARVPIDSVVRVWLGRTRGARIESDAMSLPIAVGSIVWILACGALALRSSRWR